ncbi:MAG: hypothetical protein HY696_06670 [Deltaproteobacteria bacterium]|nr:hypothetical protein [Deltaproteobacteria bacterium]
MSVIRTMQRQAARQSAQRRQLGLAPRGKQRSRTPGTTVYSGALGFSNGTYGLGNGRAALQFRSTAPVTASRTSGLHGRGIYNVGAAAFALFTASSVVLSAVAQADEYEGSRPDFTPGQHVYFVPDGYQGAFTSEHGGISILSADFFSGQTHFPFYVVIFT